MHSLKSLPPAFDKFLTERPFVLGISITATKPNLGWLIYFRFRQRTYAPTQCGTLPCVVRTFFYGQLGWRVCGWMRRAGLGGCVLGAETEFYANILIKFTFWSSTVLSKSFTFQKTESQSRQRRRRRVWQTRSRLGARTMPLIFNLFPLKKKEPHPHPVPQTRPHLHPQPVRRPAEFSGVWGWCFIGPSSGCCTQKSVNCV